MTYLYAIADLQSLFDFVAHFSEELQKQDARRKAILVGGSAFQYHFPHAHASLDADLVINAIVAADKRKAEETLKRFGFTKKSKPWEREGLWYTVDIVDSVPAIGEQRNMTPEVLLATAPCGKPFLILSPTAMIFDRLVALQHYRDQNSAIAVSTALSQARADIEWEKLAKWTSEEPGLMQTLIGQAGFQPLCKELRPCWQAFAEAREKP